jgi:hypothetical protein
VERAKEEEGVVVDGLVRALTMIVSMVSPMTSPLRLTTTVEEFVSEQVEPAEQEQLLLTDEVT